MPEDERGGVSPYFGVEEVAKRLHVSTRTIHELTRNGEIPHRVLPGTKRCLFLLEELEQWEGGADLERVERPRGGKIVRPVGTPPVRPPTRPRMAATVLAA